MHPSFFGRRSPDLPLSASPPADAMLAGRLSIWQSHRAKLRSCKGVPMNTKNKWDHRGSTESDGALLCPASHCQNLTKKHLRAR